MEGTRSCLRQFLTQIAGGDMAEKSTGERGVRDLRWLIKVFREMDLEGDRHNPASNEDKPLYGIPRTRRIKHARSPRGASAALR
jgi:hypothetical protein